MASNTPKLGLLKKDPAMDGNETFNIQTMLNDNWDKIDEAVGNIEVPEASTTQKGIVQLSNATDGMREGVAATERAVKVAYDVAIGARIKADAAETVVGAQAKASTAETNAKNYIDGKVWQKHRMTNDNGLTLNITNQNLNNINATGFYSGENLGNAPITATGTWYHVEVVAMSSGYVIQTLHNLNSTSPSIMVRMCVNGTWGSWSQDLFTSVANGKSSIYATIERLSRQNLGFNPNSLSFADLSTLMNVYMGQRVERKLLGSGSYVRSSVPKGPTLNEFIPICSTADGPKYIHLDSTNNSTNSYGYPGYSYATVDKNFAKAEVNGYWGLAISDRHGVILELFSTTIEYIPNAGNRWYDHLFSLDIDLVKRYMTYDYEQDSVLTGMVNFERTGSSRRISHRQLPAEFDINGPISIGFKMQISNNSSNHLNFTFVYEHSNTSLLVSFV